MSDGFTSLCVALCNATSIGYYKRCLSVQLYNWFPPTPHLQAIPNTGSVPALSAWTYTTTLLMMVDRVKGGGRVPPTPSPGWANFSIMMECTPESGLCYSVCTLWVSRYRRWFPARKYPYMLHLLKPEVGCLVYSRITCTEASLS